MPKEPTKILISFGARAGGFEFALQLRHDIMKKTQKEIYKNPSYVYIDAISLEKDKFTSITWDGNAGIWKMSNNKWDTHYKKAMDECEVMIFLLSKYWLDSKWCRQELEWYKETLKKRPDCKTIFVVFNDAKDIIENKKSVGGDIKTTISNINAMRGDGNVINIKAVAEKSIEKVTVDGKSYTYSYMYSCSAEDCTKILTAIKTKIPTLT